MKRKSFVVVVLVLCLAQSVLVFGQQKKKPKIKYYRINANQTIHVRLGDTLDSGSSRVGDTFSTTVVDPVYSSNGVELVPQGSSAKKSKKGDEAEVKEGTEFDVILNYAISLPAYRPS